MSSTGQSPSSGPEPSDESDEPGPSSGREGDQDEEAERVQLTPGLVALGILAVLLGVFSALVMSAHTLGR